jgi:hypothetical protein
MNAEEVVGDALLAELAARGAPAYAGAAHGSDRAVIGSRAS